MVYALAACDVVLSRGGSNTLFEALNAGKAILCCPLEKGSRGDQLKNAEYYAEHAAKLKTSGGEKIIAKALDEYAKN